MALLLTSIAGAGLAVFVADQVQKNQKAMGPTDVERTIARRHVHTGRYGNTADIGQLLKDPTQIIEVRADVDLSGVPFWWVYTRNGVPYQCYQYPGAALSVA